MSTLADLFIRLIAMFVGAIIFCSTVHGIATVREARRVGRVTIKGVDLFRSGDNVRTDPWARHD
jgi:aerobic C4-dicarboxylate transport protein